MPHELSEIGFRCLHEQMKVIAHEHVRVKLYSVNL